MRLCETVTKVRALSSVASKRLLLHEILALSPHSCALALAMVAAIFVPQRAFAQGTLVSGDTRSGSILALGELDSWTFTATQGEFIQVTAAEPEGDRPFFYPSLQMYAPNGQGIGTGESSGYVVASIGVGSAPSSGTYTVVVSSGFGQGQPGDYVVRLARGSGAFVVPKGDEGGVLTNGANHVGTITRGDLDMWSFHATQGDSILLGLGEIGDSTFYPTLALLAPNGAGIGTGSPGGYFAATIGATAPLTGTYTVVAAGSFGIGEPGDYTLTLAVMPGAFTVSEGDEGGPMADGSIYRGATHWGDLDVWWFEASQGSSIRVRIDEDGPDTPFYPSIGLYDPNGRGIGVGSPGGYVSAEIFAVAPATGMYAVIASSGFGNSAPGDYTITATGIRLPPPETSGKELGDPCARPVSCAAGNPVDVPSGNKFQQVIDYATAGPSVLAFRRFYNSLRAAGHATSASSLGWNWRGTFDRYLYIASPDAVSVERADGRLLEFALTGSGWRSDTDVDLRLVQTGASVWTLTDGNDTRETYTASSPMQARLTEIRARNGYAQTLAYDTNDALTSVTDSFGRSLAFTYTGPLLNTLTTPEGLVLTYDYDVSGVTPGTLDRLAGVTYSTAPPTRQSYLYEDATLPFALTGIIDERGERYASWTYDAQGRAVSSEHGTGAELTTVAYDDADGSRTVTNALGLQTVYRFTALQGVPKLTGVEQLASASTSAATHTFTYDANGYLAGEIDWNGNQTTYVNDARGLPVTITEASGTPEARTTTTTFHPALHLPTRIVRPGVTTDFTYDSDGNLLTRTETDITTTTLPYPTRGTRRTWTYTWSNGLLTAVRGPRTGVSQLTTFAYHASGALTSVTNALGHTTRVTSHTPGGRPLSITDPNGVVTNLAYDERLRLISSTVNTAGGALPTRYAYDAAGSVLTVTLPDGSALTSAYDEARRLTGVTDLLGQRIAYTLDALGGRTQTDVLKSDTAVTRTRAAAFDALGRMLIDTGGAGQSTRYAYDANGNALTITDPLDRVTRQAFDALNRLVSVTDPAAGVTVTGYDAFDRPLSVTAPNSAATTYVYDGFGNLIQTMSPDTGRTVYRYDLAGNLIRRDDAAGAIATYGYDALDRVRTASYPNAPTENVTYLYDQAGRGFGVGRLTSVIDAAGSLGRVYDERGNVVLERRVRGSVTLNTAYRYDAADRPVLVGYPSGAWVGYRRDPLGRVSDVALFASGSPVRAVATGITYQPFGPVNGLRYGNGIVEARGFDRDYRLTTLAGTGTAPVQHLAYAYDAADNVRSIADAVTPAAGQSFSYDVLDRLTAAAGAYGARAWTYDGVGNRLTQQAGAALSAYTYTPQSNRLTRIQTGSAQQLVSYTTDGNIAAFESPTPGVVTGFAYNQARRLAELRSGTVPTMQYVYDAFGQRIVRTGRFTGAALFQYDLAGRLLEDADGQGRGRIDYIYLEDRPIATLQLATGQLSFLHDDRLGTPQLATGSSQAVVWKASYEPFGAAQVSVGLIAQNLRLPGQEFEADTGGALHHNGFRDYVPALGRYLQSDPIGLAGGINTYGYAEANPLNKIDPSGEFAVLLPALAELPAIGALLAEAGSALVAALAGSAILSMAGDTRQDAKGAKAAEGPETGRGGLYCQVRCNVYPIGNCDTCPDIVFGNGFGRTDNHAWNNALASANAGVPRGCGYRHCHGVGGSCKGRTGGKAK